MVQEASGITAHPSNPKVGVGEIKELTKDAERREMGERKRKAVIENDSREIVAKSYRRLMKNSIIKIIHIVKHGLNLSKPSQLLSHSGL